MEARRLSDEMKVASTNSSLKDANLGIIQALDALGYNEAAEEVYGCNYSEWKKLHSRKASEAQMQALESNKPIQAQHDKISLQTRAEKPASQEEPGQSSTRPPIIVNNDILSNVCCQDVEGLPASTIPPQSTSLTPSCTPPTGEIKLSVGILTVSDRAFENLYPTGDLSGPAVETAVHANIRRLKSSYDENHSKILCTVIQKSIVPDDFENITTTLSAWTTSTDEMSSCNLIFTTGGTGFSKRDITPEATRSFVDQECQGLMAWASSECMLKESQLMASLSRGTAGIVNNRTMIVNLPGNPGGVAHLVDILFPLLLHAVKDFESDD